MILEGVQVSVQTDLADGYPGIPSPQWLQSAIRHGLAQQLPADTTGQVSLLITDDATVQELNRDYRGLDEITDVLSFSAEHQGHWEGDPNASPVEAEGRGEGDDIPSLSMGEGSGEGDDPVEGESWDDGDQSSAYFPIPDDEPPPLGDIVISLPQATRQAEQQGVPLCRELALLLVHGALHLLGHDHYEEAERDEMQKLERAALQVFFGEPQG